MQIDDAIAALASAPGAAGRGVIRICGGDLRELISSSFLSGGCEPLDCDAVDQSARRSSGWWRISDSTARIPCDVWYWPDRRCYAGQPTAELHLPGSPPLLEKVLEDLFRRKVRPARPGEFTLRAFLAGKIDLVQAEAVLGVIDARDDGELRTALSQLAGGISRRLTQLRNDLLDLLADLEAGLDFVEEDISFVSGNEIRERIRGALEFIQQLIDQSDSRMTSATRPKVVLAGLPNAGKSTLFNRLAGRDLALVSPDEGTTTDYLRADAAVGGVEIELIDTAGWENRRQGIHAAAQRRRAEQLERADLILWCSAIDREDADDAAREALNVPCIRVRTKLDLLREGRQHSNSVSDRQSHPTQGANSRRSEGVTVSAVTGSGIDNLAGLIARKLTDSSVKSSGWLGTTSVRCRDSLRHALTALQNAESSLGEIGDELLAVDLREALDHLGQVVGAVYTDDLLDRIFSKFCIGK